MAMVAMVAAARAFRKVKPRAGVFAGPVPSRLRNSQREWAVGPPKVTQIVQERPWQRHKPLLAALASDAEQHIGTVDRADFQVRGLAYA